MSFQTASNLVLTTAIACFDSLRLIRVEFPEIYRQMREHIGDETRKKIEV